MSKKRKKKAEKLREAAWMAFALSVAQELLNHIVSASNHGEVSIQASPVEIALVALADVCSDGDMPAGLKVSLTDYMARVAFARAQARSLAAAPPEGTA